MVRKCQQQQSQLPQFISSPLSIIINKAAVDRHPGAPGQIYSATIICFIGFNAAVEHDNCAVHSMQGGACGGCILQQGHVHENDLSICSQLHGLNWAMLRRLLAAIDANRWSAPATLDNKPLQDYVLGQPAGNQLVHSVQEQRGSAGHSSCFSGTVLEGTTMLEGTNDETYNTDRDQIGC
jgi:hypothetical protein